MNYGFECLHKQKPEKILSKPPGSNSSAVISAANLLGYDIGVILEVNLSETAKHMRLGQRSAFNRLIPSLWVELRPNPRKILESLWL